MPQKKGRETMKKQKLTAALLAAVLLLAGCADSNGENSSDISGNSEISNVDSSSVGTDSAASSDAENYDGKLEFDHSMELKYSERFSVDYYKGGYKIIDIKDSAKLLIVPEGMSVPADADKDAVVMQQPISNLLMNSTAMAAMLDYLGELDAVSFSTNDQHSWYIEGVEKALADGKIKYVGQYDSPDYEQLAAAEVKFGIFSSMVMDDVKAQLDSIGLTPILDTSSKETHPLAKVEWAKMYAAMFNCEEKAEQLLAEQEQIVLDIQNKENTGKSVAVFYITSSGKLYARKAGDYMTKMVELAGGNYILPELGVGETGTKNMEHEAFFDAAKDADYIIYVWSMGGKPNTLDELLQKSEILSEMKAVKDGNVWCTTPDFFQAQDKTGSMIGDINKMLTSDGSVDSFDYLVRLK